MEFLFFFLGYLEFRLIAEIIKCPCVKPSNELFKAFNTCHEFGITQDLDVSR